VKGREHLLDALLFATVFVITFAKVRWAVGGVDVTISDVTASLFVIAFAVSRAGRRDWSVPRTGAVLSVFFLAFLLVYLVGFFNLETALDRDLFAKGLGKFVVHFFFLIAAVAHLGRRRSRLYWQTLGWFVAGLVANGAYGLLQLAVAETSGGNLDERVLGAIGAYQRGGINLFGVSEALNIYRVNALTVDPNHLGVMLVVPLLVLLPLYLRLERGHRLRSPVAVLLVFLSIVELATLSRSGLLGIGVGLLILLIPYRHLLLTPRVLVPLGALVLVLGIVVAQRTAFFQGVLNTRTQVSGTSAHFQVYELVGPAMSAHPLFGLGLNTFSVYFEFVTGRSNFGPHSYYVALLTETGIVGTALFVVYLGYLIDRLGALRRVGRALSEAGDRAAVRVRPLGWGLTAALFGTMASNVFYLTMMMYYFFVFAMLIVAAPVVFARR
jgi:O-antigen ligase